MPYVLIVVAAASALLGATAGYKLKATIDAVEFIRIEAAKNEQIKLLQEWHLANAEQSVKTVTKYVDRVKVIRENHHALDHAFTIALQSADNPALPGSFRVLHDSAALDRLPEATGTLDAPATDVETLAHTVADNYAVCHAVRVQLEALQTWAKDVSGGDDSLHDD